MPTEVLGPSHIMNISFPLHRIYRQNFVCILCFNLYFNLYILNPRWRSGRGTGLQTGRSRDQFPMVSLEFFIDVILPAALWPLTEMSTRNISLGKGGRCVGLTTLPPS
jgi:hypothetical protein